MNRTVTFFPLGAILISVFAVLFPEVLSPLRPAIVPLLGVVMFGMGITLTLDDFSRVFKQPKLIGLGISMQYLLMPMIAYILSWLLKLPVPIMVGLVLVGSCPGGTASNVICYLAGGNVALSITLTSISTLLAVIFTPLMTWFYVGQIVPVSISQMMLSILKIIIIPVSLGIVVNYYYGNKLLNTKRLFPIVSVLAVIVIIGIIVAGNQPQISTLALPVIIAVILHNGWGLLLGYSISKWFGYDAQSCRTLAIEVGMQNSGLGVALAYKFFTVTAALPGAIFSIWHNISGSFLAAIWSRENNNQK